MSLELEGSEIPSTEGLEPLWRHVLANWDSEGSHAALLELAKTPEQLSGVARGYRALLTDPKRARTADRQLKKIAALAMAQLAVPKRSTESPRRRWPLYVWSAVFAAGTAWLLLQL